MTRILLIDDQPDVRATIATALRLKDFEVVAVEGGRAGLGEFERSSFDLAIVDIYLADAYGVSLIKAFRERKPDFPIVAISGMPISESGTTLLEFLPLAANLATVVCLQKPFRPSQLLDAVRGALAVVA